MPSWQIEGTFSVMVEGRDEDEAERNFYNQIQKNELLDDTAVDIDEISKNEDDE